MRKREGEVRREEERDGEKVVGREDEEKIIMNTGKGGYKRREEREVREGNVEGGNRGGEIYEMSEWREGSEEK